MTAWEDRKNKTERNIQNPLDRAPDRDVLSTAFIFQAESPGLLERNLIPVIYMSRDLLADIGRLRIRSIKS